MHARAYICRNILTAFYDLNLSRKARSQKGMTDKKKSLSNFEERSRRNNFPFFIRF